MNVIIDLDGVIWLAEEPLPGSGEAVERLRKAGHRVLFVTNNSNPVIDDQLGKLSNAGVPAERDDVITSSQAAASLVEPGSTALVCGGQGVVEALEERGVETIREGDADVVVVGFHREFDYKRLTAAFRAVRGGARLIGTNDDPTFPTPEGPVPGGGSLIAAVATAAGVEPVVAGKPHDAMADLVRERLGGKVEDTVLVGDRPSTDGLMAHRMGVPFILVLSGVTEQDDLSDEDDVVPDAVVEDLDALVGPDGHLQELA
ncbi:MAG: HAD-IIA family hydrolase [Actinomycetota bacterium]|nr:HAD-IIA family hydrolase [Actinomycetota bacterium]